MIVHWEGYFCAGLRRVLACNGRVYAVPFYAVPWLYVAVLYRGGVIALAGFEYRLHIVLRPVA